MEQYYNIIIEVVGESKEPNISINSVGDCDIKAIWSMINDIKEHRGYYPKGSFIKPGHPTARDLYRHHEGWDIFESLLPRNESGCIAIKYIKIYPEKPLVDLDLC